MNQQVLFSRAPQMQKFEDVHTHTLKSRHNNNHTVHGTLLRAKASAKCLKMSYWSVYVCSLPQIYRVSGALWESDPTRGALALQESSGWVRPHSQEGHVRKYLVSNYLFLAMNYIICLMLTYLCGADCKAPFFPMLRCSLNWVDDMRRALTEVWWYMRFQCKYHLLLDRSGCCRVTKNFQPMQQWLKIFFSPLASVVNIEKITQQISWLHFYEAHVWASVLIFFSVQFSAIYRWNRIHQAGRYRAYSNAVVSHTLLQDTGGGDSMVLFSMTSKQTSC